MSVLNGREAGTGKRKTVLRIAVILATSAAFAIAYTQSPLYTSNQNQYFLHGLASAGFGYLKSDWLANTADPTPLFSQLVKWTYWINQWEGLFYVYYAILMGIYLFSLVGIVSKLYPEIVQPENFFPFISGLIVIHSAGLRFVLSRVIGVNWTYVLEDGVADQRLLGSVFQPSVFGVFLLLSIFLFLDHKRIGAVVCAIIATCFHPTYLLSAGLVITTYMLLLFRETRRLIEPLLLGIFALVLVLPVLGYVYFNFGGQYPETSIAARQILVHFRIPHHTVIAWWFDATVIVKLGLIILALILVKKSNIYYIILVPFTLAVLLTALQAITGNAALALLFPWRVSTWLVPLSIAILLGWVVRRLTGFVSRKGPKYLSALFFVNVLLLMLAVSTGAARTIIEFRRLDLAAENALFSWINQQKTASDRYLVPIKMQEFRLITGVPIFADFKSIPYRDTDVLEWYRRVRLADKFYDHGDCELLQQLAADEGVNHVVVPEDLAVSCPLANSEYRDLYFTVYSLSP